MHLNNTPGNLKMFDQDHGSSMPGACRMPVLPRRHNGGKQK